MDEGAAIKIAKRSEIQEVLERLKGLEGRVDLLEIIAKKATAEIQPEVQLEKKVKVTQINEVPSPNKFDKDGKLIGCRSVGSGPFFCKTAAEQQVFKENNPDLRTESFDVELPADVADKHLNDPENKKQFMRKPVKQGVTV